ncbi:MAG: DUF1801 domain-containing protein [Chloroflexota bacterium]|nr:DUF1801 domain-containing protein [Chloroflexota bacterium]
MTDTQKSAKTTTARQKASETLTPEELAALKETVKERKAAARRRGKADGEADVRAKIAEMPESDRAMAERIHEIVNANAPDLAPRTWYGMPAYANKDGKVICFFTAGSKFKERYSTLGFNADAHLDEGTMWPTSWALTKLTAGDEAKIAALVKKAVS